MIIAAILILWRLLNFKVGRDALAAPAETFVGLGWMLIGGNDFWSNVAETAKALGLALLISCIAGVLTGALSGVSNRVTAVVEPILVTVYALPKVTLYPVILLFFGTGIAVKIAFGVPFSSLGSALGSKRFGAHGGAQIPCLIASR